MCFAGKEGASCFATFAVFLRELRNAPEKLSAEIRSNVAYDLFLHNYSLPIVSGLIGKSVGRGWMLDGPGMDDDEGISIATPTSY